MISLKAAMVIAVLGLAGLFTSCSSDSANTIDPMTPSILQTADTKVQVAKAKLTCTYVFGDSVLNYADAKIVYTDASGKEQTHEIDKSKLVKQGTYGNAYKFDIDTTTFPATLTAKLEVTPKPDAIASAKTGAWIGFSKEFDYTTYDKNGKVIESKALLSKGADLSTLSEIGSKYMKENFTKVLREIIEVSNLDKTFTVNVDRTKETHDFR